MRGDKCVMRGIMVAETSGEASGIGESLAGSAVVLVRRPTEKFWRHVSMAWPLGSTGMASRGPAAGNVVTAKAMPRVKRRDYVSAAAAMVAGEMARLAAADENVIMALRAAYERKEIM